MPIAAAGSSPVRTPAAEEAHARRLDETDPLPTLRGEFHVPEQPGKPGTEAVYLCGNSLGLQPRATRGAILQELEDWARLGVEGHFHAKHPWMPYHEELRETGARLVGARPGEVVAMNSLTVNLHLMMVSFYRPTAERYKIVIEDAAFPSDSYAVQSQAAWHGFDPREAVVRLRPREGEQTLRTEDVEALLEREGRSVALLMLGGVNYLTGQVLDMARLTEAGQRAGAVVGWDLAHAAGNVALRLHDWGADFACWCSYKYLNSGPGSVAGCFVHERHGRRTGRFGEPGYLARFAGWWGNDPAERFRMGPEFVAREGADAWQLSNPPILALAPVRVSLEIFDRVGMERLRGKSERLTGYLQGLIDGITGAEGGRGAIEVITPREPGARGCQLSIAVREGARELFGALTADGVMCDFREPNVIRVAPAPLYNTFHDCWRFAEILRKHAVRG